MSPSPPAPPVPAQQAAPSLKTRMLRHVMLPLVLTWLAATAVTLGIAGHFTERAFDRALLDDAYSIASHVRADEQGEVMLQITPSELKVALFDQSESVNFAVLRPDGSLLAGTSLPAASPQADESFRYREGMLDGQQVRVVTLRHPLAGQDYLVQMAHTRRERGVLVQQLFIYVALPLLLLLALLAAWLWRNISRDLAPLAALQQALARRDASDLAPVKVQGAAREIQEVAEATNSLFGRLRRSVQAHREFAGNVAHELRTPLAGIRALANYGLKQSDPDAWRQQLVQIAQSEARASRLVDQLLALALADEGEAALVHERVPLDDLVGEAVLRHLARADANGVDLGAGGLDEGPPDDFVIWGSRALVEGILDNLIGNALRHGGHTVTVVVRPRDNWGRCVLTVVDNGPGIPEAERRTLMQRWAQSAGGAGRRLGAGLGLAIVARYARLLDTTFQLDSVNARGGLRATLVFPPPPWLEKTFSRVPPVPG